MIAVMVAIMASVAPQQTVTFSATVDLSSAAYSGRFQPAGTVTP